MPASFELVFAATTDAAQAAVGALLDNINQGLVKITSGSKQAEQASQHFTDTAAEGLQKTREEGEALQKVIELVATLFGGHELLEMAKDAQTVAVGQAQLQQALLNTGQYSAEVKQELIEQAEALENLTGAESSATLSIQTLLLGQKATVDQVKELTPLVYDLAAVMGTDAVFAARQLGALLGGEQVNFGKLNITASNATQLIEQLTRAVGGQAAVVQQAKGGWGEFSVGLSQFKEWLGAVIGAPIGQFLSSFTAQVKDSTKEIKAWVEEHKEALNTINSMADGFGKLAGNPVVMFFIGIVAAVGAAKGIIALLTPVVGTLSGAFEYLAGVAFVTAFARANLLIGLGETLTATFRLLAASVMTTGGAVTVLTGAIAIAAAGFTGWEVGKFIGNLNIMGITIDNRIRMVILEALKTWEMFKHSLGITNDQYFANMMTSLDKTQEDYLRGDKKPTAAAPVNKTPTAEETAAEKRELDSATKLALAKGQVSADINKQVTDATLAENDRQMAAEIAEYKAETMGLAAFGEAQDAEYLAKRKALLADQHTLDVNALRDQAIALQREIDKVPTGDKAGPADRAKRNDLLTQKLAVDSQIVQSEIKFHADMDAEDAKWQADRAAREDEADKARAADAQKQAEQQLQIAQRKLQEAEDDIALKRAQVQNDFSLTDDEKRQKEIDLYEAENKLIKDQIANLEQLKKLQTDPAAAASIETQINALQDKSRGIGVSEAGLKAQANPNSFFDNLRAQFTKVKQEWGNLNQSLATGTINVVTNMVSGLANALTSVITGSQTAGQAFASFGLSILTNFISMILEAILWAEVAIPILTYLGIVSGGTTAASGMGVVAAGMSMAAGAASTFAMADGGLVSGPGTSRSDSIPAMLSNGEFVIPAHKVAEFGAGFFEGIRTGGLTLGSLSPRVASTRPMGGFSMRSPGAPKVNVQPTPVQIIHLDDASKLHQHVESGKLDGAIVSVINRNKTKLGMRS